MVGMQQVGSAGSLSSEQLFLTLSLGAAKGASSFLCGQQHFVL